jgi:hypothetical protein
MLALTVGSRAEGAGQVQDKNQQDEGDPDDPDRYEPPS